MCLSTAVAVASLRLSTASSSAGLVFRSHPWTCLTEYLVAVLVPVGAVVNPSCLGDGIAPGSMALFRVCCAMIRPVMFVVEMTLNEQVWPVHYSLFDGGIPS